VILPVSALRKVASEAFKQVGDPLGVLDVALSSGEVTNEHGVGEYELESTLEHMPHRLPVDARRFHRHVGAAEPGEPLRQLR
jgi:hypothetical protein